MNVGDCCRESESEENQNGTGSRKMKRMVPLTYVIMRLSPI